MVARVTTRGRSSGRARTRARAEDDTPVPANAGALRRQALESLVAEAEADLEATHGDDGSSVASSTRQEHADASEVENAAAFDDLSTFQVKSIASKFKAWSTHAAVQRQEQLRRRQADAFARGSLRGVALPAPTPSAKKPSSAKPARLPAKLAGMHASMALLAADLQSKLTNLGLEELAGGLAAASVLNMGDVISYTSGKQLRDEIERSGEFKVPLHTCNALYAKKPARAPPPTADEPDDLLDGIFSSSTAASRAPSSLPLVEALSSRVPLADRPELILNCLERLEVKPIEGTGASVDDRNAERLEESLEDAGLVVSDLTGASGSLRDARMALARALRAPKGAHAPQTGRQPVGAAHAPGFAPGATAGQLPDVSSLLSSLSGTQHDARPSTLQEEAGFERIRALASDPDACAALHSLVRTLKAGDHLKTAQETVEAQRMHPVLAQVLHHEALKFPVGVQSLGTPGSASVPVGVARELVKAAKQVQSGTPLAISRALVFPASSARISVEWCDEITQAAWFGKLMNAESGSAFDISKALDARKGTTLLGGSKGATPEQCKDWMLNVWPTIVLALEHCHPVDRTASLTAQRVGSFALGNGSSATILEGQQEVLVPFLRSYLEAWNAFARGGVYPSCSSVWDATSTASTPVAAWLTNASLRSRQSTQITALQSELAETKALLAKVVARLEKVEKKQPQRPPTKSGQSEHPPENEVAEGEQLTSKQRRAAEWRAKCAARDAEKAAVDAAANGGAPSAAPAAAQPVAGQQTQQVRTQLPK